MTSVNIVNVATQQRPVITNDKPTHIPNIDLHSAHSKTTVPISHLKQSIPLDAEVAEHLDSQIKNSQRELSNASLHSDKVRSTLPVQIAACRSLGKIGLSRKPLHEIGKLSEASLGWVNSIHRFLSDQDVRRLFPNGVPEIRTIHKLALFHDKPIRPPKRFICSTYAAFPKRRTPSIYRDALAQHRRISTRLAQFMNWIDMEALPVTPESLEILDAILDNDSLNHYSGRRRRAINWYQEFLLNNTSIEEQLATGQLDVLREEIATTLRFSEHVHFQRSLGPAFKGIDTNWRALHAYIEFSQSIHDVTQNRRVASDLIENWQTSSETFYNAARRASTVSRHIRKLEKLIKRVRMLQFDLADTTDNTSVTNNTDVRCNANNPGVYLSLARNATERLELWTNMLTSGQNNGNLTPTEVLSSLKP